MYRSLCLIALLLGSSLEVQAHGGDKSNQPYINASASFTYRNDSSFEPGQPALIPGAMLGGEAIPPAEGAVLDDAQLGGYWYSDGFSVRGTLNAHQVGESTELELEHLWLSSTLPQGLFAVDFAVGKMSTNVSPLASWHASQSSYSEASLLSDIFWGRHFTDVGVRLSKQTSTITFGVELWDGNSWPATQGEGSADGYFQLKSQWQNYVLDLGLWGMVANASERRDDRYSAGHSHAGTTLSNPAGDYRFSGDVRLFGGYVQLQRRASEYELLARIEAIQQDSTGQLSNSSQHSDMRSSYQGVRIEAGVVAGKHSGALSVERVVLENRFYDDPGLVFIQDAGLLNDQFEPFKATLSWAYQWRRELFFRTEYILEEIKPGLEQNRVNIGFKWLQQWVL